MPEISYFSKFAKSPHHGVLALATVGLGGLAGNILGLLMGVVGYAIGWIFLPESPIFKGWVDKNRKVAQDEAQMAAMSDFSARRERMIRSLTEDRRAKYVEAASMCSEIETETASSEAIGARVAPDARLRKLDELLWTYLRLLRMGQSLVMFLESERKDDIEAQHASVERQVKALVEEIASRKGGGQPTANEERLLTSRDSMMTTIKRRLERVQEAEANVALVRAEQERLIEQIRLLRADAFAMQNSNLLSDKIDASMHTLEQTNQWLSQMDNFQSVVDGGLPQGDYRLGSGVRMDNGYQEPPRRITISRPKRIARNYE